jgi:hypothetical protein
MPATPIYALPYPAATDPADVPLDMQELATQIEVAFGELAYVEATVDISVTATADPGTQLVALPPINFAVNTIVLVEFFSRGVQPPQTAGAYILVKLSDNGVHTAQGAAVLTPAAGALNVPVHAVKRLTATAGSHTFIWRAIVSAGSGYVSAGATFPMFARLTRA